MSRLLPWIWTATLLVACFLPSKLVEPTVALWVDKVVHFVLFAGFSGFWLLDAVDSNTKRLRQVLIAGLLLAVLTEIGQGVLPIGRSAEWWDLGANLLGLLTGIAFDRQFTFSPGKS